MDFLRVALLWGLPAVLLPVLIHLLGRRRVRPVPIATLRFLERARVRAAAHLKLRRILLLAARMALLAAVVLLFAGPGCETADSVPGARTWAVVLDTSPSMAAARDGPSSLERGRRVLTELLDRAGPEDRFFVTTTVQSALREDDTGQSLDRDTARRWVAGAVLEHGPHRVSAALERVFALLSDTPRAGAVLVTDLQASTWPQGALGVASGPPLRVVDVGLSEPANSWVGGVTVDESDEQPDRVTVRLGGGGSAGTERSTVALETVGGGRLVSFVDDMTTTFRTRLPAGLTSGAVVLSPGGDLAADDRLEFVAGGRRPVRVLLVNGDPRGFEIRDELLFVRRAFASGTHLGQRLRVREVRPGDVDAAALAQVDVILFANPGPLPEKTFADLLGFLEGGGGLVVSGGDRWQLSAEDGVSELGAAVLAAPPRDVLVVPPDDPSRPPYLTIDEESMRGPLARFRDPALGGLGQARVHKYWVLDAAPGTGMTVWARLENDVPLLVERAVGRGRSLLLTTTLDRDGADLCLQPAFLPLLEAVLLHAADRLRAPLDRWALAGYPHALPYQDPVQVMGPDGAVTRWSPGDRFTAALPGVYRISLDGEAVDAFAARVPVDESDLARLGDAELKQRLGAVRYSVGAEAFAAESKLQPGRNDLSGRLAAVLLALLAAEVLLSTRWYRRPVRDLLGGEAP